MGNGQENLIPFQDRTEEELRVMRRNGGIASGKTRRMQKTFKDMAKAILELPLSDKEKEFLVKAGIPEADRPTTKKGMLLFSVAQKAIGRGDSTAMMRLAELTGEHIDEKKISVGGDVGERRIINIYPKGNKPVEKVIDDIIKAVYIDGSAYGTDGE